MIDERIVKQAIQEVLARFDQKGKAVFDGAGRGGGPAGGREDGGVQSEVRAAEGPGTGIPGGAGGKTADPAQGNAQGGGGNRPRGDADRADPGPHDGTGAEDRSGARADRSEGEDAQADTDAGYYRRLAGYRDIRGNMCKMPPPNGFDEGK